MKTRAIKSIFILALLFFTLPLTAQDWMEIQFKDGMYRKYYLEFVKEMVSTKYDAEGIMHDDYEYLRVVTSDDEFTYLLSDIDNISFTKYDEETAKHNFVESNTAVLEVLYDNQTLAEAEKYIDEIKNVESVEDAWSDGHELFVKVKGVGVIPFHFSHDTDDEENETIFNAKDMKRMKAMLSHAKVNMSQEGKQLRAVIANQGHFDKRQSFVEGRSVLYSLLDYFQQSDIQADYNEKPTIDFFYDNSSDPANDPHLYDYDIVFLLTHGGYSEKSGLGVLHDFMTGDVLGEFSTNNPDEKGLEAVKNKHKDLYLKYRKEGINGYEIGYSCHQIFELSEKETGTDFTSKWVYYPTLSQYFFKNIANGFFKNPKSILFNGACQTLKGKEWHTAYFENEQVLSDYSLANEFLKKNLGVYLGYNQPQSISPWACGNLFYFMMNGLSLDKAVYSLPNKNKAEHFGEDSSEFLAYLMRVPDLSNEDAGNVFMVSTYTNESDQTKVNQEYSQSQTVTVEGITTHLDDTVKDLKYGFRYKAVDIGQNPLDSWNPVELWKEEPSVEAELVPMTINSDKGNRLFKATLTDLEPNKTYVYRAYTYDGMNYNYGEPCAFTIQQGGNFTINTCPDDHHPHLIDLGLPSGTKWACCNVGASKPEEIGGYYVWGATEEDEAKDKNNLFTYDEEWDYYEYNYRDIGNDIAGTQYDVAHVKWGGSWVMPNKEQMQELIDNCTSVWIENEDEENEIYLCGRLFTSSNGSSVFLPGGFDGEAWYDATYWSSSLNDIEDWQGEGEYKDYAYLLYMDEEWEDEGVVYGGAELFVEDRWYCFSVRPVINK